MKRNRVRTATVWVVLFVWMTSAYAGNETIGPDSRFWKPPKHGCSLSGDLQPLVHEKSIYGYKYQSKWHNFITSLGLNIVKTFNNPTDDAAQLAGQVTGFARDGAFTVLDFEGPGGPSPVYTTSLTLITTAYAFSLIDQKRAWPAEGRETVVEWGNRLDRNQDEKYQFASPDSKAAIGAARMLWGAVTQQPDTFARGMREFDKVMGLVDGQGRLEENPRDNNEDIALLVLAAEAAEQNGIRLYDKRYNGKTLHDAVDFHMRNSIENKDRKFSEVDTKDKPRRYFRGSGFAAHLSWMPIYLSRFPDAPISEAMIEEARTLPKKMRYGMSGLNVGGATECLWGVV